jgi:hypothetical protein
MRTPFRVAITINSAVAAFYFVFWVGGAIVAPLQTPLWIWLAAALLVAGVVGRYVWRHTPSFQTSLVTSIMLGAVTLGGLGFSAGFWGPLVFMPDANQGPLLGIFITGPLGFMLGALGGGAYWFARERRSPNAPNGKHA